MILSRIAVVVIAECETAHASLAVVVLDSREVAIERGRVVKHRITVVLLHRGVLPEDCGGMCSMQGASSRRKNGIRRSCRGYS